MSSSSTCVKFAAANEKWGRGSLVDLNLEIFHIIQQGWGIGMNLLIISSLGPGII